ncbi:MAG: hypothetical protein ACM3JD_07335, partial [Rudaea sp.]
MKCVRVLVALFGLHFVVAAHAYELATHGRITYYAYMQSTLFKDHSILKDLGLKIQNLLVDEPFGTAYYDFTDSAVGVRYADPFESSHGRMPDEVKALSLPGWLLRGAIREDDLLWPLGNNPQDDPYGNIIRVRNHFYDPIGNSALTVAGVTLGEKAPDWALGATNAFAEPVSANTSRRNHFTVLDAREAMYRALTGRNKDNQEVAPTKDDRNKYWATLFRALGDIVHLVQDMGQPQHTRNDPHSGVPGLGHKSVYELYADCRATQNISRDVDSYNVKSCGALPYTGYPDVVFTKYS